MKYKTLFRILLKAIGVWLFCEGMGPFVMPMVWVLGFALRPEAVTRGWGDWTYIINSLPPAIKVALGLYLFFGGRWIADLAVPGNRPYCHECGYDLTGLKSAHCPECGTPFKPGVPDSSG